MSRIGKLSIIIPTNVNITLVGNNLEVRGPNGTLNQILPKEINVEIKDELINVKKTKDTRSSRQKHGLIRSLIKNMILGTTIKFQKKLQMVGVGYRAQVKGKDLILNVGYSHSILLKIPENIDIQVEANTNLTITSTDKAHVGLLTSRIRSIRPPEPYKGKGIKYTEETVLRKAGKSGKK
jgi:large subunit ribosomal protein L6